MKIYTVDAFTDQPFHGNPAGVCPLSHELPDTILQAIAREMNLSETAFFLPINNGFHLRWFTPLKEVDLCGHATLATAHILWQEGYLQTDQMALFSTLSGELRAKKQGQWIEMDFPRGTVPQQEQHHGAILQALGIREIVFMAAYRPDRYLIELPDAAQVRCCSPNFSQLSEIGVDRIMITARSDDPRYDFVSRYFAPGAGINEDPVTGSAHTYLTPYWAAKLNKTDLHAYQASARGGILQLHLTQDRVIIRGQAITMLKGTFQTSA